MEWGWVLGVCGDVGGSELGLWAGSRLLQGQTLAPSLRKEALSTLPSQSQFARAKVSLSFAFPDLP